LQSQQKVNKSLNLSNAYLVCFSECNADEHEYRLTKYLLSNYEPSVRPVANSSDPIVVIFGLSIHHIIDVDEKNQILTVNCWLSQVWNDTHLTWNSSDFGGILAIALPYDKVWRPDVILYNK
jgi:nicotinic acetylcholine receptor